jgi:lipoprotein-anchoring transpeptidase ErfK/SrfK
VALIWQKRLSPQIAPKSDPPGALQQIDEALTMSSTKVLIASLLAFGIAGTAQPISAQSQGYETFRRQTGEALTSRTATSDAIRSHTETAAPTPGPTDYYFKSRADSLNWEKWKKVADNSSGFRILVSLQEKHLWVVIDEDTLLSAPVAVASGQTLSYQGFTKTFDMPRGTRTVRGKDADPVWTPPKWLYYETAAELGLKKVVDIPPGGLTMPNGWRLYVNDNNEIGVITEDGPQPFIDKNLHLIFDDVLYVPPVGTENRKVNGTLGKYKLDLGDGFLFHGTPLKNSIGMAATHGCVRLRDEDIEWLYENIPVGTKVYVY